MEKMKNWKNKIVQWNKKELERNPQKAERPKPKSKEEIDREMAICDELRKKEREEFLAELNKH